MTYISTAHPLGEASIDAHWVEAIYDDFKVLEFRHEAKAQRSLDPEVRQLLEEKAGVYRSVCEHIERALTQHAQPV